MVKYDGNREIAKARLIARGFQDKNFYELSEMYSPVINGTVFRWIISLTNRFSLTLCAIDVKTALLNSDIDSNNAVYTSIPEGVEVSNEVIALKLCKTLYGLKVSSKKWFLKFTIVLIKMGFNNFIPDQCVFFKDDGVDILFLFYM